VFLHETAEWCWWFMWRYGRKPSPYAPDGVYKIRCIDLKHLFWARGFRVSPSEIGNAITLLHELGKIKLIERRSNNVNTTYIYYIPEE